MRLAQVSQKYFRLPVLLAFGALIWISATGHWTVASWQTPAAYSVDALEVLARFKISGDAGAGILFHKVIPRLGAPWGADWSAYPMPDALVFILFGELAKVIGLIAASNVALLSAHLAAIATFYGCSRALGHRAAYSAGAAILFGFSFYNLHRGLSHFSFALSYVVPAQLLVAWLIGGSHQLLKRRRWQLMCLLTAAATGAGNPYFSFGFCQLVVLALAYQLTTRRTRINLQVGAGCLIVLAVAMAATNYSSIIHIVGDGAGLLQRNYASTEIYGLRPIELLIPPPFHRWAFAASLGTRYAADTSLGGELFFPYLGFAGIGGVFVLGITTVRLAIRGKLSLRPAYAPLFGWLVVFFIVGGVNSLLAFSGIDLFRAGNRYSIYLLALSLFALTSWTSRHSRRLNPWIATALALVATVIGLWDQLPRRPFAADRANLAKKVADDQRVAARLDTGLRPGSAVFQLPVEPFLEQPPVNGMTDYELFRPWLFSERTGFSYGMLASEKALRWEKWIASRPAGEMCRALETAGYAAIYLHKKAFGDAGTALIGQLTALGYQPLVNVGDQIVFALHSVSTPALPDVNAAWLMDSWSSAPATPDQLQLYAEAGWFALERNGDDSWRWAGENAKLAIWNPADHSAPVSLQFNISAIRPAHLAASFEGREILQVAAGQTPGGMVNLALTLQPGANHVDFHFTGHAAKPSATDRRLLGFRLINLHFSR